MNNENSKLRDKNVRFFEVDFLSKLNIFQKFKLVTFHRFIKPTLEYELILKNSTLVLKPGFILNNSTPV